MTERDPLLQPAHDERGLETNRADAEEMASEEAFVRLEATYRERLGVEVGIFVASIISADLTTIEEDQVALADHPRDRLSRTSSEQSAAVRAQLPTWCRPSSRGARRARSAPQRQGDGGEAREEQHCAHDRDRFGKVVVRQ